MSLHLIKNHQTWYQNRRCKDREIGIYINKKFDIENRENILAEDRHRCFKI